MLDKDKSEIEEISAGVSKIFTLQGTNLIIDSQSLNTIADFKDYLASKIAYLIENNFDLLINILYRIDIGEEKLQKLFSGKNKPNIPEELSELIIERQLQKIHFRKKYKQGDF
jgi:hypothetical protein